MLGPLFNEPWILPFVGEKDKFVVIYLDDITVFSNSDEEHLRHLRQVFLKCRRYGLSLNPKKSHFSLEQGKLLGHIVCVDGVKIDPARVIAIQKISIPRTKKEIQSFLGKINFLRRFIPNFVELVKHITDMLKKGSEIKWRTEAKYYFQSIKKAISDAPVLISPDFEKEFLIFSFASQDTLAAALLQRNSEGFEQPISFFSRALRDAELKYDIMEKQDFSLVKALKYFRVYVLHSKIIAYVPSSAIKDILTQSDNDGKRSKWIAKLLEYDMEIKPTKLVKGKGLAKLLVDSNCRALGVDYICNNSGNLHPQTNSSQVNENIVESEWYKDILYFLQNFQAPPGMDKSKVRSLKLKVVKYCVNNQTLFWRDPSGFLLRCLDEEEAQRVMS
jgi:hypothetical protein